MLQKMATPVGNKKQYQETVHILTSYEMARKLS